jgi:hypothetical protein
LARLALRSDKGRGTQVVAVHCEDVKSVELDLMIEFAGMESVEIRRCRQRRACGLAIDDELLFAFFAASTILGKALAPIVAAARDQTDAIAVALDPQAKAGA